MEEIEVKLRFTGKEKFTLPKKQNKQYLQIFPDAETDDAGRVVCRIPREYTVTGNGVSGCIIEHPLGYSWFVNVKKYPDNPIDRSCKGISGISKSVEEAVSEIKREIANYRRR